MPGLPLVGLSARNGVPQLEQGDWSLTSSTRVCKCLPSDESGFDILLRPCPLRETHPRHLSRLEMSRGDFTLKASA